MERAIFWIEYVLRNGDAEHLNVASRDLPFYTFSGMDIFVVVMITLYLIKKLVVRSTTRTPTPASTAKKNR